MCGQSEAEEMINVQTSPESTENTDRTADIVAAYVSNNSVPASELPALIATVHQAISKLSSAPAEPAPTPLVPAVPVRKSVTPEYIICLEDGKKFKSLKRHLRTRYDLTPEQYRAKWNLPRDYPMVAPSYAAARSELAKSMGLGQQRKKSAPAPVEAPKAKAKAAPKPAAKAAAPKPAAPKAAKAAPAPKAAAKAAPKPAAKAAPKAKAKAAKE